MIPHAELEAEKRVTLGQAQAGAQQLQQESRPQKFQLAVDAFAEGLPSTIDLQLFYAGEGTLRTDVKSVMPTLPVREPPP
jgi:hypothetical protein